MDEYSVGLARTHEAMSDPQPGDRFSEFYTYWMYVVARIGDAVITMEASAPCVFPEDGEIRIWSLEKFRQNFSYGTRDGYWMHLTDRGNDVSGWLDGRLKITF